MSAENLKRLREAFPGLVWTVWHGSFAGGMNAHTGGPVEWLIVVEPDLSGMVLEGRLVSGADYHASGLGHAPISNLGRIIALESKRLLAKSAALTVTGRLLRRATGAREWAAVVLDKEYGMFTATTRHEAIDLAVEGALEDVYNGHEESGTVDVEIFEDPEWCEKAPQFCSEHDHAKHARWLENQAGETIEVEVYSTDPDDEDSDMDWREVADG